MADINNPQNVEGEKANEDQSNLSSENQPVKPDVEQTESLSTENEQAASLAENEQESTKEEEGRTDEDHVSSLVENEQKKSEEEKLESIDPSANKDKKLENQEEEEDTEEESSKQYKFDPSVYEKLGFEELIKEAKSLMRQQPVEKIRQEMVAIRNAFRQKSQEESEGEKQKFLAAGGQEVDFEYRNPHYAEFYKIYGDFKANLDKKLKEVEKQEKENLKIREQLIEDLKNLYQGEFIGNTNIFKKFQDIKQAWYATGRVPRANYRNISRTWKFHLDNFYQYLDLNKELREMNYAHHLEMRLKIIARANVLVEEPNLQKALNELQFLHKQWKEETVPVAEEHREPTWQEFKRLTDKIHDRKHAVNAEKQKEYEENLVKKEELLAEINQLIANLPNNHKEWQKAMKQFNTLREKFKAIGFVPRHKNQELWDQYRETTRTFNRHKNNFYKTLKKEQQENLEKKEALLAIARDNVNNENWQEAVELYKKIQSDWKKIGHVPFKVADKIWKEFRGYCDEFFDNYKNRNNKDLPEYENNYDLKKELLEALQNETFEEEKAVVIARVKELKSTWKKLGKVPKDKLEINQEFDEFINKILNQFELNAEEKAELKMGTLIEDIVDGNDNKKLEQEIKSTKKNLEELDTELRQLETNLNFFSNADSDNPLLADAFKKIEQKRKQITNLEIKLRKLQSVNFDSNENTKQEDNNNK